MPLATLTKGSLSRSLRTPIDQGFRALNHDRCFATGYDQRAFVPFGNQTSRPPAGLRQGNAPARRCAAHIATAAPVRPPSGTVMRVR
jgi:hypothetical protein